MKIFQKYSLELDVDRCIDFAIDDSFRNKFKNGITVSFWYKGMGWGGGYNYDYLVSISSRWFDMDGDGDNDTINRISFQTTDYYIEFQRGVSYYIRYTQTLTYNDYLDNQWHYYVGIISEDYMKLYVDNDLIGQIDFKQYGQIGIVNLQDVNFDIAKFSSECIGKFGELRVYNRALTKKEVEYLYNGGHIEDGLVFWLYPNEEDVVLDDDGQTVLQVTERINGYVGTAYNGVKLVDGKDIDELKTSKKVLVVKRV